MLLFPNPVSGGDRGGTWQHKISTFLTTLNPKKSNFEKDFKLKFTLPKSPRGPPDTGFGKSNISAFTGKKANVVKFLDQFLEHFEVCTFWMATRVYVILNLKSSKKEVLSPI